MSSITRLVRLYVELINWQPALDRSWDRYILWHHHMCVVNRLQRGIIANLNFESGYRLPDN